MVSEDLSSCSINYNFGMLRKTGPLAIQPRTNPARAPNHTPPSPGGAKRIPGPAMRWRPVWIPLRQAPEQVRGNSFLILLGRPARAARPRPETHAGIRPDWTCLVKGAKRRCAVRTLDETSPVWRPAWQGFQGWVRPARAGAGLEGRSILWMLGLRNWVPVAIDSLWATIPER